MFHGFFTDNLHNSSGIWHVFIISMILKLLQIVWAAVRVSVHSQPMAGLNKFGLV